MGKIQERDPGLPPGMFERGGGSKRGGGSRGTPPGEKNQSF